MKRARLAGQGTEAVKTITCLVDRKWAIKNLLYGESGIAALMSCEVPIRSDKQSPQSGRLIPAGACA